MTHQERSKKLKKPGIRRMQVYSKGFERAYWRVTFFPEIRLCGKWLRDSGFEPGETINVHHEKDKIVITKYW